MAVDIAAPYTTAAALTTAPNPELGGLGVDLSNKDPLLAEVTLQKNAQAEQQRKQQIFENQQQEARFKNDTSSRIQSYALQNSLNQQEANRKFIQQVYNQGDVINPYNHTDANGNQTSLTPPDGHQDQLSDQAGKITKAVLASPLGSSDPNVQSQFAQLRQNTRNSGAAAAQLAALKVQLAQTSDPPARANLQSSIDKINNSKVSDPVQSYQPIPLDTHTIPEADEWAVANKDDKLAERFTAKEGTVYKGMPNSFIDRVGTELPGTKLWNAIQNKANLFAGTNVTTPPDPAAKDPAAFAALQQRISDAAEKRGMPTPNIGQIVTDANGNKQVVLNNATPFAKREMVKGIDLANPAAELQEDLANEDSDKDIAETGKINQETANLKSGKGSKPTAEQLKEDQNREAVKSAYNDVQKTISATLNTKPVQVNYPDWWKKNGIDPNTNFIYKIPEGIADKYIGIEAPVTTSSEGTGKNTLKETTVKGESIKADDKYLIVNKKTGEKEIKYVNKLRTIPREPTDDNPTKTVDIPPKIVAGVGEKQLVINKLMADDKYDPKEYGNKTIYVDEIYRNKGKTDDEAVNTTPVKTKSPEASRPTNIPASAQYLPKNKVWYDGKEAYDANGNKVKMNK